MPTRLGEMPERPGMLWLQRALGSVGRQSLVGKEAIEVVIGLDRDTPPPAIAAPKGLTLRFANAAPDGTPGQASAINAAAEAATGDLIAILEDDDAWHPVFLATAAKTLKSFDFVSSSQMLVDETGTPREPMYFPTPSGWLMRRDLWRSMGGFDETIRFHVDMEWLGRLNQTGKRRAHLVERGFPLDMDFLREHRKWLAHIAAGQPLPVTLVQHAQAIPLVVRTLSPGSGTNRIRRDPDAARQSQSELDGFRKRFGVIPW
jgi:glycosyltransferase involved in cell wall biosynthesis